MADDFDLYDDLDDALIQPLDKDVAKKQQDEAAKLASERRLADEVENLRIQLEEMTEKKNNLNNNMTYLLTTSKEELARKDSAIKEWQRKWDELMFRRKKSTRAVGTQTDFPSGHRSRDRSHERRPQRSPEKSRRYDKGSSSEKEQKHRGLHKATGAEGEQKYRGSSRDERSRNDRVKKTDRPRDARKRSRSKSTRRIDEKRRKYDDQKPKHIETSERRNPPESKSSDSDLRMTLLKKPANRSSPRKLKADTTSNIDPEPTVKSPRKRRPVQSHDKSPVRAVSVKTSDSDVEIVSALNFKKVPVTKPKKQKISQNVESKLAEVSVEVDDGKPLEVLDAPKNEEAATSFNLPDDASKSPKLNQLEKEISAAENFDVLERVESKAIIRMDSSEMLTIAKKIVDGLKKLPANETITITVGPAAEQAPDDANLKLESSPANPEIPIVTSEVILEAATEVIEESPAADIVQNHSATEQESPRAGNKVPLAGAEADQHEPSKAEIPVQQDHQLQLSEQSLNGTLDSSGASKENSLDKSQKKKRSSKVYEKEVQEDGTVVFTITRKSKKKKKDKSKT